MPVSRLFALLRQATCRSHNDPKTLGELGSQLVRASAASAVVLLVIASAGYGCVFAWTMGSQHGVFVALLAILMALGLEIAKPLAVHGVFASFGAWRIGRGFALLALACVAIAYSLTSELALMSATRSDLAAQRGSQASAAKSNRDAHERAKGELETLAPTRPAEELQALIASVDTNPKIGGCRTIRKVQVTLGRQDTIEQTHCPKLATMKVELARANKRKELEDTLAKLSDKLEHTKVVEAADPGSTALAIYLSALGIAVAPQIISQWLNLVPVLALELGSALAAVLFASVSSGIEAQPKLSNDDNASQPNDNATQQSNCVPTPQVDAPPLSPQQLNQHQPNAMQELTPNPSGLERFIAASQIPMHQVNPASMQLIRVPMQTNCNVIPVSAYLNNAKFGANRAHSRQSAEQAILDQLKIHGSSAKFGAQRTLAAHCGINQATFNRAANELLRKGLISIQRDGNRVVMQLAS